MVNFQNSIEWEGKKIKSQLTLTAVLLVWVLWSCAPKFACSLIPPPAEPLVQPVPPRQGRCLMPSSRRTRRMLLGNSSTPLSTSVRHSGHRSSPRDPTMPSRQRRQNVCWHGRTLAVASSRSRHTGHSSRSSRADSSMVEPVLSLIHCDWPLRWDRHIARVRACIREKVCKCRGSPQLSCHARTTAIVALLTATARRQKQSGNVTVNVEKQICTNFALRTKKMQSVHFPVKIYLVHPRRLQSSTVTQLIVLLPHSSKIPDCILNSRSPYISMTLLWVRCFLPRHLRTG